VRHPGRLIVPSAEYRIIAPEGNEVESGTAQATVASGALDIQPDGAAAVRVPFGRVASIGEPQPYTVAVTLDDGHVIELRRMGAMRTQLLAELRDARAAATATEAGAVGQAEVFPGWADDGPVEAHVHEDALLLVADSWTRRLAFSFIDRVAQENYAVEVALCGGSPVVVSRLGRRTSELTALLEERLREARGRTAAFLGSLLPGLDPMTQRSTAALLRDGVAVPARALDAIHPQISVTLLRLATQPERFATVAALAQHVDLAIGFKQAASVRVAASGGTPWHDPSRTPHIQDHEAPQGLFRPGLPGLIAREVVGNAGPPLGRPGLDGFGLGGFGYGGLGLGGLGYGGPFGGGDERFGGFGNYWAYQALGNGINWNSGPAGPPRQMMPRADVRRGTLTPPSQDLAALTLSGEQPTVLAFALFASSRGRVAYDVLNAPDPVTYVYEADGDARAVINQALDDTGFQAAAVHAAADGGLIAAARTDAPAVLLARSLVAQVPHGEEWQRQIAALLS
jgi:hypothetical protein